MRRKPGGAPAKAGAGVRSQGRGREMGNEGTETGGGQEPGWGLKGGRKQRESEAGKDRGNLGDGKEGEGLRAQGRQAAGAEGRRAGKG